MKSMKKSMFVTTILMVVLLIVALSTATFAWYTSNTNVGARATQVTTAASNAASLVVDGGAATSKNESNSFVVLTMNQEISPMVYVGAQSGTGTEQDPYVGTAPQVGTTTYGDFTTAGTFKTFTVDNAGNFASVPANATPSTISAVGGGVHNGTEIFLTNVGGGNLNHITASVAIENYSYTLVSPAPTVGSTDVTGLYYANDDGTYTEAPASSTAVSGKTYYTRNLENENLCVAIFAGASTASNSDLVLKGVFSNLATVQVANATTLGGVNAAAVAAKTSVATIVKDDFTPLAAGSASTGDLNAAPLGQLGAIKVLVVAWFDGTGMTNNIAGTGATFTISFTAA